MSAVPSVSPEELQQLRQQGSDVELIDVRTPIEYAEVHVDGARLVPLDMLDPQAIAATCQGKPVYVLCRTGGRAAKACEKLQAAGMTNVYRVEGGTLACAEAGLPMVRGRNVISLERQVRIAAGFLVVMGVVLGWLVHPAFLGLAAFVGAGLMFAGITNTCGMALLLAKMPWNRAADGASCSIR